MSIFKSSINKPITTALVFVAVLIIGLFSLVQLPVDLFPEIEPPYISVMTTYPGANASEIESNITRLLENSLSATDGLKELTSRSMDNLSIVTLEFKWGLNLDEIINDIRSSIDMVKKRLPDGAENPVIFKFSTSSFPIIQYAVTANESYLGLDKIMSDIVSPRLNRVEGIGNIAFSGTPDRYIYVDINQEKLDSYGIPLETVGNAIGSNNINLSSGTIKMPKEQYQLQVRSEYLESKEINDIVVSTTSDGRQVYVRDIATVRDTIKDLSLDEKVNGKEGIRLIITKQTGANTVEISKQVEKEMAKIYEVLPSDIEFNLIYDSADDIQDSISSLQESVLYALLFVVFVVLFFLGRWRATLIIALTIPISLVVAFIYLAYTGSSLNIISLSSLSVAIGMVVDDAIVVLENITKHIERGANPREAAIYGTSEVWVSVIATTLVIVAVFVPLTMLTGMAGIMFKELGWIVTIVVVTSTLVAISLTPMLSSKLLKTQEVKVDSKGNVLEIKRKSTWYDKYVVKQLDKLDNWYAKILRYSLKHKLKVIIISVVFFIVSVLPLALGYIGTDFMQHADSNQITVTYELNQGTRVEETLKLSREIEKRLMVLIPEMEIISTAAGSDDDASISSLFSNTANNKVSMTIRIVEKTKRERSVFEISEVIRNELASYPEIIEYQAQTSGGMGGGGVSSVNIEIYGHDFDVTNLLAENLRRDISSKVEGARDIQISRDKDRSELKITVDKEKIARHGLDATTISMMVKNRVSGMLVGFLKEDGEEYNIVVRTIEENRSSISDIEALSIPTMRGNIKLGEIATVEEYWSPPTIERKSRQRAVTVKVYPYKTSLGELANNIKNVVDETEIPRDVNVLIGGDYETQQETFADMGLLLALIVMLVYIVMASQFESFGKPFIIMMGVPFAFSGVVIALLLTGISFDMIGALGVIMLVGIVVKNGIVLVDYTNLMRDRGYELNEAIALSGASRLRPVLMTALTTALGMLPMALSQGSSSEIWRPMGVVVMGGLIVSTAVTLIIVPVLYGIVSRSGERDKVAKARKNFWFLQISDNGNGNDKAIETNNK